MTYLRKLDRVLKEQAEIEISRKATAIVDIVDSYAKAVSTIENAIVVVSDLRNNISRIYAGKFAELFGLGDYREENSIWENEILRLMSEKDREEKFLAELRFFHFVKHLFSSQKDKYYLITHLKMTDKDGEPVNVIHKMRYVYEIDGTTIAFAICVYEPDVKNSGQGSEIVNSISGISEPVMSDMNIRILSNREIQILSCVQSGYTSEQIAKLLCISKHTVSRHRQEIIAKLQVRNTHEAIAIAKSLGIIR